VPGETEKNDLLQIIDNLPMVDVSSIWVKGGPWKEFNDTVGFSLTTGEEFWIYLLDDKVSLVSIHPIDSGGDLGFTFGDAVERFSEPESLIIVGFGGPGILWFTANHTVFYAITPEKGINFGYDVYYTPKRWRDEINPEIPISMVDFFDPDSYQVLLEARMFSMGLLGAEETLDIMRPWTGYGEIEPEE
jgi:hypothetical protein